MWAAKVQASLRICAVSPEPSLLAYTSSESRGLFRQKARSLAPLNGWACAAKICHECSKTQTRLMRPTCEISRHQKAKHFICTEVSDFTVKIQKFGHPKNCYNYHEIWAGWIYHTVKGQKMLTEWQIVLTLIYSLHSLILVYTVCPDLFVQNLGSLWYF